MSQTYLPHGRPYTEVDITEEDADFQEQLRLLAPQPSIPIGLCWYWLG